MDGGFANASAIENTLIGRTTSNEALSIQAVTRRVPYFGSTGAGQTVAPIQVIAAPRLRRSPSSVAPSEPLALETRSTTPANPPSTPSVERPSIRSRLISQR